MALDLRLGLLSVGIATMGAAPAASAAELGEDWIAQGQGRWVRDYQSRPIVKQGVAGASGRLVSRALRGRVGSWRCVVEAGPNAKGAGIVVLADETGRGGLECLVGGTGEMRGFALRTADGKVLWSDAWAPWMDYEPCVVEAVVEHGRVRVQLLMFDGKTLMSQSEWVKVDPKLTNKSGLMGLLTDGGIGRFWGWRIADRPLAAITPDAPNKRRITPGKDSPWLLVGPMTWQWTSAARERIRQTANVERAWAFNKDISGVHRRWSCRVKVSPPSGGAGMAFQADGSSKNGFLCWLGGTYGNGCLMLYDRAKGYRGTVWCGPQGKWKYDTEYVLIGETKPGQVRVQMLAADGKTVISESPWKTYDKGVTDREGMIGFHTWKGSSAFWAFSDRARGTAKVAAKPDEAAAVLAGSLGQGWTAAAGGWQWKDAKTRTHLIHLGKGATAAVDQSIRGIHGVWRCRVKPCEQGTAELLFQASADAKVGFAATLVVADGKATLKLTDLPGRVRWYSKPMIHQPGMTYVLEGVSTTDRKRARLRTADGKTILADSDEVYVSDAHNTRVGYLGVRAAGGAEFTWWSFVPEK